VGAPLSPISVVEQDAFSRFASGLAEAVIEAATTQRQLNAMRWNLDAIDRHHGLGALGATSPPAVVVKVIDDLQPLGSGHWQIDGLKLHGHLREQNLRPTDADAELHAADGGQDLVYRAHLDEVPDAKVSVDLAALPAWLAKA
jgi:hypothetical protein